MLQKNFDQLPLWQFGNLSRLAGIRHYVSGRDGGVSTGELGTFNLGQKAGDHPDHVRENRRRLARALGVGDSRLVFPSQTHSTNVKRVTPETHLQDLADTDALVTNTPGLCINVMSADCVPVLLFDPVRRAVGAVHAGWRGTVGRILTHTVEAMQREFGTRTADLVAGIGPSICAEVYEVGEEVLNAVEGAFGNTEGLIRNRTPEGKGFVDLWEANRRQLLSLGVPEASIEVSGICTFRHADQFFSARKSKNRAGRFAAGIVIGE
jgi:YfiH family protein